MQFCVLPCEDVNCRTFLAALLQLLRYPVMAFTLSKRTFTSRHGVPIQTEWLKKAGCC